MRKYVADKCGMLIVAVLLAFAGPSFSKTCGDPYVLTRSDISRIESQIEGLPGGGDINEYGRTYAGRFNDGHYVVTGVLIRSGDPTIDIVPHEKLPVILDGGCDVITIKYDFELKTLLSIRCNGEA